MMIRLIYFYELIFLLLIILLIIFYFKFDCSTNKIIITKDLLINPNVNIIDPDSQTLNRNFTCVKSKTILNLYQTTLCLHSRYDTISKDIAYGYIWEEQEVTKILKVLIDYPQMDVIDIGANIGGFTMFTAGALGRFTLAIDCYLPNIERIARAIQIENVQNRVILIHNVLYNRTGESLRIEIDDPSGITLANDSVRSNKTEKFIAKSIRFDDLFPILKKHQIRNVIIKIDIETSESYMCETGENIFNEINIPFIMMEWHSFRINHKQRYQFIVEFFLKRNYTVVDYYCQRLNISDWLRNWPGNVYWIKQNYSIQSFC